MGLYTQYELNGTLFLICWIQWVWLNGTLYPICWIHIIDMWRQSSCRLHEALCEWFAIKVHSIEMFYPSVRSACWQWFSWLLIGGNKIASGKYKVYTCQMITNSSINFIEDLALTLKLTKQSMESTMLCLDTFVDIGLVVVVRRKRRSFLLCEEIPPTLVESKWKCIILGVIIWYLGNPFGV
jgi:hypothetical protein